LVADSVLAVRDAKVVFDVPGGTIRAVDGVSLSLDPGKSLAVVGESGCGKTTLAKAALGLEPLASGTIHVQGKAVTAHMKGLAKRVGMVWQDPYASLDPRWRIGRSIAEPMTVNGIQRDAIASRLEEVMGQVGLERAFKDRYPHQLSGGQRQRVAIARALALNPPLLICDEPTAALDLSIRAQILNLLKDLQRDLGCAYLYISHDLTTVRFVADTVAVMYLGRIVEIGDTESVFTSPRHPYSRALLDSAPTMDRLGHLPRVLPGEIPDPRSVFVGCRFASRCKNRQPECDANDPPATAEGSRTFCCFHPVETAAGTTAT
jgi:oligopeptide/dipeptide ABC transporter ATP-binding protein